MNNRTQFFFYLAIIMLFTACIFSSKKEDNNTDKYKFALLKTDKDFASLSVEKGMKNAYLEYIDSNGVLLRPNSMPILDAEAVDYIIALKDTGYSVSWAPSSATVAQSGELGYTYGTYEVSINENEPSMFGTYITIWKKQADGKWKFVLQSNNEGVE
jgi:hypothetical protein